MSVYKNTIELAKSLSAKGCDVIAILQEENVKNDKGFNTLLITQPFCEEDEVTISKDRVELKVESLISLDVKYDNILDFKVEYFVPNWKTKGSLTIIKD